MSEPIISVSGLRGIVGESLTPEVAVRYAAAFAATLPPGPILVTHDGRTTGPQFLAVLCEGLTAIGRDILNAGVAATPTTGVLVRQHKAVGGIQISASHNPPEYNGLKLFAAEGRVIPAAAGAEVMARYRQAMAPVQSCGRKGTVHTLGNTATRHVELALATVNFEQIRRQKFKVLLDSNHGAGSVAGRKLLEQLDCEVTPLGGEPDGKFSHAPEPTADNLAGVLADVVSTKAAVGFCQDPDADRLAVIDERGRYIGEEYTLAICANHILSKAPGPVVTNCSTSRMTEDIAKKYHVPFFRSAVGEANVVDLMLKENAILGGEGNGGVIDPRVVLVRDSITAMALILDAMASRNLPVSALADELPRYDICKTKITFEREKLAAGFAALEAHFRDAAADRLDGLRLDWPNKWLLVRSSNTEPIVRAIAEAPSAAEAERLCKQACEVLSKVG